MGVTATDELRRLLDERGVEWIQGRVSSDSTAWLDGGAAVVADEYGDGLLLVERKMTPEQAIEATLGRGTCKLPETRIDHGSIEYNGTTEWRRCSRCNAEVLAYPSHFCPSCGAEVVE